MKTLSEQNLYEILEVAPDASEEEIIKAWDRINALYGPGALATYTLISAEEAELLSRRLEEAISTLLDPVARDRYDSRILETSRPETVKAEVALGSRARKVGQGGPRMPPPIIPPLRKTGPDAPLPPPPRPAVEPVSEKGEPEPASSTTEPADDGVVPGCSIAVSEVGNGAPLPDSESSEGPTILEDVEPIPEEPVPILLQQEEPSPIPLVTPAPISALAAAVAPPALPTAPEPVAAPPVRVPPLPKDFPIPEGVRFTGDVLRRAREARGISIQQMSERTKVTRHHIENIEGDRYGQLPAPVYLRGILMSIARELRLDGQKVARSYLDCVAASGQTPQGR